MIAEFENMKYLNEANSKFLYLEPVATSFKKHKKYDFHEVSILANFDDWSKYKLYKFDILL